MKKGFTLVELLVGLVISLFLGSMILIFMVESNDGFQIHRDMVQSRNELRKGLILIAQDLTSMGFWATQSEGQGMSIAEPAYFMDYVLDANQNAHLTYWLPNVEVAKATLQAQSVHKIDDLDVYAKSLSSSQSLLRDQWEWTQVDYRINPDWLHPITGVATPILERNGTPFLMGVTDFKVELGVDLDGDGMIEATEWTSQPLLDETTKKATLKNLYKIHITIETETAVLDGQKITNKLSQEIYLRNRGLYETERI